MEDINLSNITLEKNCLLHFNTSGVETDVLRLDKVHRFVSGNKWFKLRYYLDDALKKNKSTIVTFGGPWSNHLLATAAACSLKGLKSVGIVRGEKPGSTSAILEQTAALGMQHVFISRNDYREKTVPAELKHEACYHIPEGGYGALGIAGASLIADHCDFNTYSHICCASGTGTTAAGLVNVSPANSIILAISVLKNNFDLEKNIHSSVPVKKSQLVVNHDYSFGGYAKYSKELLAFMNVLYKTTAIPSDFVYTAKLFFGVVDLQSKNYFPASSKILVIHTGGLAGNASLSNGTLIF